MDTKDKLGKFTPVEVEQINRGILFAMTKEWKSGHIGPKPIRCDLCHQEVLILPINEDTPRNPENGQPMYETKVTRTSSLDHCMRCHAGKKDT